MDWAWVAAAPWSLRPCRGYRLFLNGTSVRGGGAGGCGVVLNIKNELGVPVKFIGVGEKVDDLRPFNARAFAEGLFDAEPIEDEEEKKEDE